jgi:hypothetical protein
LQFPITTWELSILPVPGERASKDQRMNFLHNQLDRISAGGPSGHPYTLLDGLRFLGSGPHDRLQGGVHRVSPCSSTCDQRSWYLARCLWCLLVMVKHGETMLACFSQSKSIQFISLMHATLTPASLLHASLMHDTLMHASLMLARLMHASLSVGLCFVVLFDTNEHALMLCRAGDSADGVQPQQQAGVRREVLHCP